MNRIRGGYLQSPAIPRRDKASAHLPDLFPGATVISDNSKPWPPRSASRVPEVSRNSAQRKRLIDLRCKGRKQEEDVYDVDRKNKSNLGGGGYALRGGRTS